MLTNFFIITIRNDQCTYNFTLTALLDCWTKYVQQI